MVNIKERINNARIIKIAVDKLRIEFEKIENLLLNMDIEDLLTQISMLWFDVGDFSIIEPDYEMFTRDDIDDLGLEEEEVEETEEGNYMYDTSFFRYNFYHPSISKFYSLINELEISRNTSFTEVTGGSVRILQKLYHCFLDNDGVLDIVYWGEEIEGVVVRFSALTNPVEFFKILVEYIEYIEKFIDTYEVMAYV